MAFVAQAFMPGVGKMVLKGEDYVLSFATLNPTYLRCKV